MHRASPSHTIVGMLTRGRWGAERGAALLEYALIMSLIVVATIGATNFLEDETGREVDNQADCISTRPPPPSCQAAPLSSAGGGGGSGGSGGGSGGGSPVVETATLGPSQPVTATPAGTRFAVIASVDLFDSSGDPLPDVVMTAKISVTVSSVPSRVGQFSYYDCVTNGAGRCTFSFDSEHPDVDQITFDVISAGVDTSYEFGDYPIRTVDRP